MELTAEHKQLIEELVKKNPRLSGNEDLYDDFCNETYKRSISIISSINDINSLELYLNKVISSAILSVLKDSGRIKRSQNNRYEKIKQTSISTTEAYQEDENSQIIYDIPDFSISYEERIIQEEEAQRLRDIIVAIDLEDKTKKYREIYFLRYIKDLKQSQIAQELNLSQGEVSKRLNELIQKIKKIYR